jgi:hypothetical protein
MADDKSLFERGGRSALADGAARFDALARELKAQQVNQSQGASSTAYQPAPVSPDEAWARNFMTQGIGPRVELPNAMSIAPAMQMPMANLAVSFDFAAPAAAPANAGSGKPEAPSAIGARLGKPEQRRSWLGRMLRPKS